MGVFNILLWVFYCGFVLFCFVVFLFVFYFKDYLSGIVFFCLILLFILCSLIIYLSLNFYIYIF